MHTGYRAATTGTMGPAGTEFYRIVHAENDAFRTGFTVCLNCKLCPASGLLPVRPRLHRQGYIVPVLQQVMVRAEGENQRNQHMLPVPFAANLIPYDHPRRMTMAGPMLLPYDPFGLRAYQDLTSSLCSLIRLVPDLKPEAPFTLEQASGHMAGEQQQGWEGNADADDWLRHPCITVVYGRDQLRELSGNMDPGTLARFAARTPIVTSGANLAAIIHASRLAALGLPEDPQRLWDIWQRVAPEDDAIERYHKYVVDLTD